MKEENGILTIAIGKKYAVQAKYLALSFMLHSPKTLRAVITDRPDFLYPYYDNVILYNSGMGDPFCLKTRLYLYTPFANTLYIDADSLLVNSIDECWESLKGKNFVYTGNTLQEGVWYFDIKTIIGQLDLPWLPEFNSGMFLFSSAEETKNIFDAAYYYMKNQDAENLRTAYFRKTFYPDEPFFAIALAQHKIEPYNDHCRFSRTLIGAEKINIDVIRGIAFYYKDKRPAFPCIVHFCGRLGNMIYFFQKSRLFLFFFPSVQNFFFNIAAFIRNRAKKVF